MEEQDIREAKRARNFIWTTAENYELEPLYLACEGRMVIMAPKEEAGKIVEALRKCPYSKDAAIIGEVTEDQPGKVVMTTEIGTQALLPQPGGELLPRIC